MHKLISASWTRKNIDFGTFPDSPKMAILAIFRDFVIFDDFFPENRGNPHIFSRPTQKKWYFETPFWTTPPEEPTTDTVAGSKVVILAIFDIFEKVVFLGSFWTPL